MEKIGREYCLNVKVFFREPGVGYKKEIQNVYNWKDLGGVLFFLRFLKVNFFSNSFK